MIVIRDQQLRLMVLAHLIRELQAHAQDHGPIPEGFSEKQIEELQALSSAELVKLSEMAEPRVAIQIDSGCLIFRIMPPCLWKLAPCRCHARSL